MPAALTLLLGGVDITSSVDFPSVTMQLAGSQETATCEFDIVDTTDSITAADEATLSVTEVGSATVLFGGFVRARSVVAINAGRIIHVTAVDYNSLLDRSIVVSDHRVAGESDHARLAYLMTTYGTQLSSDYTQIATLNGSMPAQKFIAITLRQAIERVLGAASTKSSYYVDPTGRLHTYDRSVVTAAPFDIVVGTPGGGELAPETFSIDNDSSNLVNAVYVVGATTAGSGWFTDTTSIATYGRRERFFNAPDADTYAKARQVGLAVLEDQKNPAPRGSFTTQSPKDGWRIGQSVSVTSPAHGLVAATYRIARVSVKYLNPAGARDYTIEIGAPLRTLSTLLAAAHGGGGGYPWVSPGGPGSWPPVIGSGGTGGVVSGGGGCACNTPYTADAVVIHDELTRVTTYGGFGGPTSAVFDPGNRFPTWTAYGVGFPNLYDNGSAGVLQTHRPTIVTAFVDLPFGFDLQPYLDVKVDASCDRGPGTLDIISFFLGLTGITVTITTASIELATDLSSTSIAHAIFLGAAWSLRIEVQSGGTPVDVRFWRSSDPEPVSPTLSLAASSGVAYDRFDARLDQGGGSTVLSLLIDDLYIEGCAGGCADPNPGQPYPWTNLGAGNGSRTTFSTLTPFLPGSLEVRVDSTRVTASSQTSTTGDFTLSFAPSSLESVWARWTVAG